MASRGSSGLRLSEFAQISEQCIRGIVPLHFILAIQAKGRSILPRRQHYRLAGSQAHHYTLKSNVAWQATLLFTKTTSSCALCDTTLESSLCAIWWESIFKSWIISFQICRGWGSWGDGLGPVMSSIVCTNCGDRGWNINQGCWKKLN